MLKIDLSGLEKLEQNAKILDGENRIEFSELFNSHFMVRYTKVDSIDLFFENSPFLLESEQDFENISEMELNEYVKNNSSFDSWQEMLAQASTDWISKMLGF